MKINWNVYTIFGIIAAGIAVYEIFCIHSAGFKAVFYMVLFLLFAVALILKGKNYDPELHENRHIFKKRQ